MTNITTFVFNGQEVRVVGINGKPWFVAKDVLMALNTTTTLTALKALILEELGEEFATNQYLESNGGCQETMLLSEPALTLFVSRSRTEMGKKMSRWIHVEVLPAIREKGFYSMDERPAMTQIQVLQAVVNQMAEQEQRQLALERQVVGQQQVIAQQSQQISGILIRQTEAEEYLNSVERSAMCAPAKPTRAKIVELARKYAVTTASDHRTVCSKLYREVYSRIGFDLKTRANNAMKTTGKKVSPLDIAEEIGILDELFAIASDILKI